MFKLEIFSGLAVLIIQSVMCRRPNIKFRLHVDDVSETKINTVRPEEARHEQHMGFQSSPTNGREWHNLPKLPPTSCWIGSHESSNGPRKGAGVDPLIAVVITIPLPIFIRQIEAIDPRFICGARGCGWDGRINSLMFDWETILGD